ncbi:MAG: respiratory nitrate reductase subunit gamma [Geodermatophilaceae bacterium]
MNDTTDIMLWVVVPYVCLAVFVVGHLWRYRYDKFGWTTRSSQLYERRLLRIGSPLFHFGILGVFLGHVVGLGVPKSWTEAVGVSQGVYHFLAASLGAVAGAATVIGMLILIYRRRTVGPVFSATTRMDKVMYLALATVIILGLANTVVANVFAEYDYREGVSVWFRGIFVLQPHRELMAAAPIGFPGARDGGHAALRAVAVHPPGARVQRTGRLPMAPLRRVPQQGRATGRAQGAARLGTGVTSHDRVYLQPSLRMADTDKATAATPTGPGRRLPLNAVADHPSDDGEENEVPLCSGPFGSPRPAPPGCWYPAPTARPTSRTQGKPAARSAASSAHGEDARCAGRWPDVHLVLGQLAGEVACGGDQGDTVVDGEVEGAVLSARG